MAKNRPVRTPKAPKKNQPKNPPRVTVEVESVEFRKSAESAVRRIGYMNLSDYLRAQLNEAIAKADRLNIPKGA